MISGSVGAGGQNRRQDVEVIQNLINFNIAKITPIRPLTVDGRVGPKTNGAIAEFQRRVVKMNRPDSRVDPRGRTLRELQKARPKTTPDATLEKYIVRNGDTISSIVNKKGPQCRVSDVEKLNGLVGRYDLVVGQCLAVPKAGASPFVPPATTNVPTTPSSGKDQTAKKIGDPFVYFPTSEKPESVVLGGGLEVKFDEHVFAEGRIRGIQGNFVEYKVSFAGVIRVGRKGTIANIWETNDGLTKYRADLIEFGKEKAIKWFGGVDLGFKKIEPIGNDQYRMELALVLGSKFGDVAIQGSFGVDSQGGYTFTASRKVDKDGTTDDGTAIKVRGDFKVQVRFGPDMQWVLATYLTWKATKRYTLDWLRRSADKLAKIDWKNTAATGAGVVTMATAGIAIYRWCMAAKALGGIFARLAASFTGVLIIILPPDFWEREYNRTHMPHT